MQRNRHRRRDRVALVRASLENLQREKKKTESCFFFFLFFCFETKEIGDVTDRKSWKERTMTWQAGLERLRYCQRSDRIAYLIRCYCFTDFIGSQPSSLRIYWSIRLTLTLCYCNQCRQSNPTGWPQSFAFLVTITSCHVTLSSSLNQTKKNGYSLHVLAPTSCFSCDLSLGTIPVSSITVISPRSFFFFFSFFI